MSGCVSGAAFVPNGLWPEKYTFLFADFIFHELYSLTEAPENECRTCSPAISRFRNETFFESIRYPEEDKNQGRIVDLFFGPYKNSQALYVIKLGKIDPVYRIRYTGIHDDPPFANFTASKQNIDLNEEVQFDGSGSYDPEGKEISFQWSFGDDATSTAKQPTHSYDEPGKYMVTLLVKDAVNQVQQKSMTILVGDPPIAAIISPAEGDEFYVGQVLRLEGNANYLNGTAFNDSQLQWEVRKHHDDHYHPFVDATFGNNIDLSPAPDPEDFYASSNSYLEVILYATDDNGLTTKISRNVQPSLVVVEIDSNIEGLNIQVNGEKVSSSSKIVLWKNQQLYLKAEGDSSYRFVSWSDGFEDNSRSVVLNYSDPAFTANFCALNGTDCSDQVLCCSGYCRRDTRDVIISRSNSILTGMICIDEALLSSAPTYMETKAPTAIPSLTESGNDLTTAEHKVAMTKIHEDSTATLSPVLPQTESVAGAFADMNRFLLVVSVAITFFVNV